MKTFGVTALLLAAVLVSGSCASKESPLGDVEYTEPCWCGSTDGDILGCTSSCCYVTGVTCKNEKCICRPIRPEPQHARSQP